MRVVFWTYLPFAKAAVAERVGALEGVELTVSDSLPEILDALPGADGLITFNAPQHMAAEVLATIRDKAGSVKWIHFLTAGREDFEAAGIPEWLDISGPDGATAPAVAEHCMALMLALVRRVPELAAATSAATWERAIARRMTSLEGGTLLVLGMGAIGREIARRARGFGMRTVAATRNPRDDALFDAAHGLDRLPELYAQADAVAVALALAPETRHLVGEDAFSRMRPNAILVNVSRGGLVDPAALNAALRSGSISGAALDVTEPEPLPPEDPLWSCPNILISPHIAGGGSPASLERTVESAVKAVRRNLPDAG